jgi:hypothetical protein
MTPKEIFELETIGTHHWGDNDAFWYFVYKEIDEELFRHADAKDETRIVTLCKAKAEESCLKRYNTFEISYWAITFDGKLVGIIVLWGRFGTELYSNRIFRDNRRGGRHRRFRIPYWLDN